MDKLYLDSWAAGIFEGEGSFIIHKDVARGLTLSSTDLDVLQRLKENYGGNIYSITKRKEHWKDAWIWSIRSIESVDFYNKIKPFLLERRTKRGEEWFSRIPIKKDYNIIIELFNKGYTHAKIAEELKLERSSITHFLNRRGIKRK